MLRLPRTIDGPLFALAVDIAERASAGPPRGFGLSLCKASALPALMMRDSRAGVPKVSLLVAIAHDSLRVLVF